jgi:hypothetical protein
MKDSSRERRLAFLIRCQNVGAEWDIVIRGAPEAPEVDATLGAETKEGGRHTVQHAPCDRTVGATLVRVGVKCAAPASPDSLSPVTLRRVVLTNENGQFLP